MTVWHDDPPDVRRLPVRPVPEPVEFVNDGPCVDQYGNVLPRMVGAVQYVTIPDHAFRYNQGEFTIALLCTETNDTLTVTGRWLAGYMDSTMSGCRVPVTNAGKGG